MTATRLLVTADTHAYSGAPTSPQGGSSRLGVADNSRAAYIHFNQPFPTDVTIIRATLRLRQYQSDGAARSVTVNRANGAWVESQLTWNSRPGGTGASSTLTRPAAPQPIFRNREWAFDVRAIMQQVADGGAWYGFRVITNNATPIYFASKDAGDENLMPVLEIEWSDAPDAPTVCSPSGGLAVGTLRPTFRMDYTDPSGADGLQAVQVQVDHGTSYDLLAADSGEYATDVPEWTVGYDLNVRSYQWRCRTQDLSGLWSPWSANQTFEIAPKGTLTLTNPTGTIASPTPTWSWSWDPADPDDVQRAYQIFVFDPDDSSQVLWTSGKRTSSETSTTLPASEQLLLDPGVQYTTTLRLWGKKARSSQPDDPVYSEATGTFTFTGTGDSGITDLAFVAPDDTLFPTLTWKRATKPTDFVIFRDGKTVAVVDADDAFVSGTSYAWVDRDARPGRTHEWGVTVRNGQTTRNPVTVTGRADLLGVWLYGLRDNDIAVCIAGESDGIVAPEPSESTAISTPHRSKNPVMISSGVRGHTRRVVGTVDVDDLDDWEELTRRRGYTIGMKWANTSIRVQVYNVVTGHRKEFGSEVDVSFDTIQILR